MFKVLLHCNVPKLFDFGINMCIIVYKNDFKICASILCKLITLYVLNTFLETCDHMCTTVDFLNLRRVAGVAYALNNICLYLPDLSLDLLPFR